MPLQDPGSSQQSSHEVQAGAAVILSALGPHGCAVHEVGPWLPQATAVTPVMADLMLSTRWSMSILMSTKMYMQGTEVMSTGTRQLWP